VPVGGPPLPLTVAVRVTLLLGELVKAVDELGESEVVVGTDAAVYVMVMSQELN
jgi:hypothetical protein